MSLESWIVKFLFLFRIKAVGREMPIDFISSVPVHSPADGPGVSVNAIRARSLAVLVVIELIAVNAAVNFDDDGIDRSEIILFEEVEKESLYLRVVRQ